MGIAIDRERLRLARLRKGWTLTQVSDRCRELGTPVDYGNYRRYELGTIRPGAPALRVIAEALDLDVADLALPLDAA